MKIYSMTATFGKLEHETLTLKPGLNIIEAPNEWGKSTWCAFLVNMLYGIETRAKTTKNTLAEKERYAPWSGSPMSGRIDLNWNGRDITIERRTKGRLIFGDFRAYETESGLDIPELNSVNCGQMLLGVERSVFTRAGFLRLADLPVTQDEALRRRLNNLVTTGDESGAGDKLAQKLKDLKNKCRYNRSGLLPQAEAQRDQLEQQIYELQDLNAQSEKTRLRQQELGSWISKLKNHAEALAYEEAKEDAAKVAQAENACALAQQTTEKLEAECAGLPSESVAEQAMQTAQTLQQSWMALQMEAQMLPQPPVPEDIPDRYQDMSPDKAVEQATFDTAHLTKLQKQKKCCVILSVAAAVATVLLYAALMFLAPDFPAFLVALAGIAAEIFLIVKTRSLDNEITRLFRRHAPLDPGRWISDAEAFACRRKQYEAEKARHAAAQADLNTRKQELDAKISEFAGEKTLGQCQQDWNAVANRWRALGDARRDLQQTQAYLNTLRSMAQIAQPPSQPDTLTQTREETEAMLSNALAEQTQNQLRLGQLQGQAKALGQEAQLRQQLKEVKRRIGQLEDYYRALELAQNALHAATGELQRRFAPRIAKRAQTLFGRLTGNRYDRLTLSEDMSLQAGAAEEDTLRASQWRSDGTVDQLYLALRLAVAEELTPEAPLILDDALVRFDNQRLAAAMDILKETAQSKQVILFTCQSREQSICQ